MKLCTLLLPVLCILLALTSCVGTDFTPPSPASEAGAGRGAGVQKPTHMPGSYGFSAGAGGSDEGESSERTGPPVYEPPDGMTPEETVEAYFEQQYLAYTSLEYIDTGALHDMTQSSGRNAELWYEMLIQRRRLIAENGFCYVNTDEYPYTITFLDEEELEDDRIQFWRERNTDLGGEVMVHLVITGEPGVAYPPMMAVGCQHSIRMREVDGVWKIIFHYYPGAVRRYRNGGIERQSEEEMLEALANEFDIPGDDTPNEASARSYNGASAAWYAAKYIQDGNPNFYRIGDWMGNCANFTSQCLWYGFLDSMGEEDPIPEEGMMTGSWYAGGGGGSPAWENTEYFWKWATESGELQAQELYAVSGLRDGDLVQSRTGGEPDADIEDDDEAPYNHSLIVADAETLLLAQNSPCSFVYYCDLLGAQLRMLRPIHLEG